MKKIIKEILDKKNIMWLVLALFIIVIVIIFFPFRKKIEEVKIENHELYQYLTGIKIEYTGKIKINKDNGDIVKLSFEDVTVNLDSTPIYYKDSKKVLFPKNMGVIYPVIGEQYKINYYSTIYIDSYNDVYVKDGSFKKFLVNSVIYDGNDIYFFVDKVKVSFGNESFNLDPFSYILVDNINGYVGIYDKTNDKYLAFNGVEDDVLISTDSYKVNASLDYMYYNNKTRLLVKEVGALKNLEK